VCLFLLIGVDARTVEAAMATATDAGAMTSAEAMAATAEAADAIATTTAEDADRLRAPTPGQSIETRGGSQPASRVFSM
jgi:hypothetical protein